MSGLRQVLLGVLAALLSSAVVIGSFTLAMVESGRPIAQEPRLPVESTPSPLPPIRTSAPGEPTFTASPTLPTSTPALGGAVSSPEAALATPTLSCPHPQDWIPITVMVGDTLEGLARVYGIPVETLKGYNCLVVESLAPGSLLFVPGVMPTSTPSATPTAVPAASEAPPADPGPQCGPFPGWVRYTVQPGDTLARISLSTGASISQLQQANCLGSSTVIRAGQGLYVPRLPAIQPPASPTTRATATTAPSATAVPPTATLPAPTAPIPTRTPLPPPPTQVPTVPPAPPTPAEVPPSPTPAPPTPEPPTSVPTEPPTPATEPPIVTQAPDTPDETQAPDAPSETLAPASVTP